MIIETKKIKKFIFFPAVIISAGLNAFLFQSFGAINFTKIIFGVIGVTVVMYQIFCLREMKNASFRKSKNKNALLFRWLFVTAFSLIATLSFGFQEIEKVINSNSGNKAKIDILNQKILITESLLKNDDTEIIKKQISDLQKETAENTEYGKYRNNKKINELRQMLKTDKTEILTQIENYKIKRAEEIKKSIATENVFLSIGKMFLIGEKWARFIFLFALALTIEMIIYSTSNFTIVKEVKSKKKKESKQLLFKGVRIA